MHSLFRDSYGPGYGAKVLPASQLPRQRYFCFVGVQYSTIVCFVVRVAVDTASCEITPYPPHKYQLYDADNG